MKMTYFPGGLLDMITTDQYDCDKLRRTVERDMNAGRANGAEGSDWLTYIGVIQGNRQARRYAERYLEFLENHCNDPHNEFNPADREDLIAALAATDVPNAR